jgi:hypothetical protein
MFWSQRWVGSRIGLPFLGVGLSLFFLTILGFSYTKSGFFRNDELYYIDLAHRGLLFDPNRFLWIFINYIIVNFDVYLAGLPLKLINIPISIFSLLLLWRAFDKNLKVFYLPLFLPYYSFISVFNFRDHLILFFTLAAVISFYSKGLKGLMGFFAAIIALFFLRPYAAAIILIMLVGYVFILWLLQIFHGRIKYKYWLVIVISVAIVSVFSTLIIHKFNVYYQWFVYTTTVGADKHMQLASGGIATGNRMFDFGFSLVRYIVTPLPTSIMSRLLEGGSLTWGWFDDVVRIFNQCGYYFLLIYLLINLKILFQALRVAGAMKNFILCSLMMYWPIYSFHLYGSTHQRLKISFQLAIFLMFLLVRDRKRNCKRKVAFNA